MEPELLLGKFNVEDPAGQTWTAPASNPSTARMGWSGKRAFDVVVGGFLLLLSLPLLGVLALGLKLNSRGPVFFRHIRVGRNGEEFRMLKFRTMVVDSEDWLHRSAALYNVYVAMDHKIPDWMDPRITRVGRLLRASSLDELPQLLNVVKGDMSLVGPRPVERAQLEQYLDLKKAYLSLRPGMTGLWQVSGRSTVAFPQRAEIDHHYFTRCRLGMDLMILLRTPLAVFKAVTGA